MAEPVKFVEEEMNKINTLQQDYVNLQNALGQISVNRIRLEQQLDELASVDGDLTKKFVDTQEKERNFLQDITKKYGEGSLNPETGVFTANKSE